MAFASLLPLALEPKLGGYMRDRQPWEGQDEIATALSHQSCLEACQAILSRASGRQ